MLQKIARLWVFVGMVVVAMTLTACGGPRTKVATLNFAADPSLKEPSGKLPLVEVGVVGASGEEVAEWEKVKPDDFFSGDNKKRAAAQSQGYIANLVFTNEDAGPKQVKVNEKIWETWKQREVTSLIIFANSKNISRGGDGPELRRRVLPMTTDRWKTDLIEVVITSGGIEFKTPPLPPKK
jgi:hypothetical protein